MALDMKRKSIVREDDGTLSLAVAFFETDTGDELDTADVQGADAAEIEARLRTIAQTVRDAYIAKKQLESNTDGQIDSLRTELGLPTT